METTHCFGFSNGAGNILCFDATLSVKNRPSILLLVNGGAVVDSYVEVYAMSSGLSPRALTRSCIVTGSVEAITHIIVVFPSSTASSQAVI